MADRPEITVDLQQPQRCGAFRIHLTGYPWWDAMKGELKDEVELWTSLDGQDFRSLGKFNLDLRWKDLPVNPMGPDHETFTAPVFELIPPQPVEARYVRYRITARRFTMTSEVQVFDWVRYDPMDLRIPLPEQ
ncbi:MAG: discoidin domain-containing protein [Thermoguttaceae bacterium]